MKPTAACRIIFHQLERPSQEEYCQQHSEHIIEESKLCKLDDYEYREKDNGKVCHETELELVDGRAFLATSVQGGVQFVAKQLQHKGSQQDAETDADTGDKRQSGHHTFQIGAEEHHQSCGDRKEVEEQQKQRGTVFQHLYFSLNQREMSLGKQGAANQRQFPPESDKNHCKQEQ